ncbi:MAG: hypothetical protein KBD53_08030 [Candidatus Omnitrophica bacterium]|nr:hypothetical protein [Candidatus Omnitrophota bacterium]
MSEATQEKKKGLIARFMEKFEKKAGQSSCCGGHSHKHDHGHEHGHDEKKGKSCC